MLRGPQPLLVDPAEDLGALRRASLTQRSTIGARSSTGSSPRIATTSAWPIVDSGARTASSESSTASGTTAQSAPSPWRTSFPSAYAISTVSEPDRAVTIRFPAARSSRSASSSASSHPAPRSAAARGGADRSHGPAPADGRRRTGPCRRASRRRPQDGCARELAGPCPRASYALMLQPTGHMPQTVGTFWISGRAWNLYVVEVSAPTGQSSITLPLKGPAVRLVLEGGDHRQRTAVLGDQLPVFGDVLGEPRAAVAEDAPLPVEGDQRADRDRLVERPLREPAFACCRAPAERQILERALAALVADRAVERVVDEDELERRVLPVGRLSEAAAVRRSSRPARSSCRRLTASAPPPPRRGTSGRRRSAARAAARSRRRDLDAGGRLDEPLPRPPRPPPPPRPPAGRLPTRPRPWAPAPAHDFPSDAVGRIGTVGRLAMAGQTLHA